MREKLNNTEFIIFTFKWQSNDRRTLGELGHVFVCKAVTSCFKTSTFSYSFGTRKKIWDEVVKPALYAASKGYALPFVVRC
jgi:hypothetical protein